MWSRECVWLSAGKHQHCLPHALGTLAKDVQKRIHLEIVFRHMTRFRCDLFGLPLDELQY